MAASLGTGPGGKRRTSIAPALLTLPPARCASAIRLLSSQSASPVAPELYGLLTCATTDLTPTEKWELWLELLLVLREEYGPSCLPSQRGD